MKLNQFAVYRVDQQTAGKALWHLPYQEARQQNVSITVENYRLISIHEMQENEKVADIWKRTKNQCEVSAITSIVMRYLSPFCLKFIFNPQNLCLLNRY